MINELLKNEKVINFEIKPFGVNILVEPRVKKQIAVGEKSLLADYGKVIAIGEDVKKIKVGDIIVYRKWGLIDVEIDDKVYLYVPETDKFIVSTLSDFIYE